MRLGEVGRGSAKVHFFHFANADGLEKNRRLSAVNFIKDGNLLFWCTMDPFRH